MDNILQLELPPEGLIDNWIIAGDWHSGSISIPTFKCLIKYARTFSSKPNLIINGDFLDCEFLMPRLKEYKVNLKLRHFEEHFVPLAEEEIDWGNEVLDCLQKEFDKVVYVGGNHCLYRYKEFMKIVPHAYKHNFDLPKRLKLEERGIPYVQYNDWVDLGPKLTITHGAYHGTTCLKKHYEAGGAKNVIFSHVHTGECKAFTYRGETRKAWSTPAMCNLNPEYLRNRPTAWSNGFLEVNMRHDGTFNCHTHEVWEEKLVVHRGEVITP